MKRARAFIAVVIVVGLQFACDKLRPEEVEAKIIASAKLTRIDKACKELPKPTSFRQIEKGLSGNADLSIVYYRYASDLSFDEVKGFFNSNASGSGYSITNATESNRFLNELKLELSGIAIFVEQRPPAQVFNISCIHKA